MAQSSTTAARIAEIENILRSGVKRDKVDGHEIEYDHASLRIELRKLRAADGRRPVVSGVNMGGF